MRRLHERGEALDLITVHHELERAPDDLRLAGGPAALALLSEHASIAPNVRSYAAIVREQAQRREYKALGQRITSANGAPTDELAAIVHDGLALVRDLEAPEPDVFP